MQLSPAIGAAAVRGRLGANEHENGVAVPERQRLLHPDAESLREGCPLDADGQTLASASCGPPAKPTRHDEEVCVFDVTRDEFESGMLIPSNERPAVHIDSGSHGSAPKIDNGRSNLIIHYFFKIVNTRRDGTKSLNRSALYGIMKIIIGLSPSGKAHGFGPCIRGFESLQPSQVRL